MARAERQPRSNGPVPTRAAVIQSPSYVSRRPVYTLSNLEIATVNRNLAVRTALSSLPPFGPLRTERRASGPGSRKVLFFTVALLLEVCLEGGSASAPRVACDRCQGGPFWQKPRPGSLGRPTPALRVLENASGLLFYCHHVPSAYGLHQRLLCVAQATGVGAVVLGRQVDRNDQRNPSGIPHIKISLGLD